MQPVCHPSLARRAQACRADRDWRGWIAQQDKHARSFRSWLVSFTVTASCLALALCVTSPGIAIAAEGAVSAPEHAQTQDECQKTVLSLVGTEFKESQFYNQLGWCYQRRGEKQKAIAAFKSAIRQYPKEESNYITLITVLSADRYLDAALDLAKQTVHVFPASAQAYKTQGLVQLMLLLPASAIASYTRAAQLNPHDPSADLGIALAETASGRVAEARLSFQNGLKRFPNDPAHYVQYARFLLKLSDPGNKATEAHAIRLLKKAVKLDNDLPEAHFLLGILALRNDNLKQALRELQAAVRLNSGSSKAHFALARTYRRMGHNKEASQEDAIFAKLKKEGR